MVETPSRTFSSGNFGCGVRSSQVPGWMCAGMSRLPAGSTVTSTPVLPPPTVGEGHACPVTPESLRCPEGDRRAAGRRRPPGRPARRSPPASTRAMAQGRTRRFDGVWFGIDDMARPRYAVDDQRTGGSVRRWNDAGGPARRSGPDPSAPGGSRRSRRRAGRRCDPAVRRSPSWRRRPWAGRTGSPGRAGRRGPAGPRAARTSRCPRRPYRAAASS